jgi:hypothetical protein
MREPLKENLVLLGLSAIGIMLFMFGSILIVTSLSPRCEPGSPQGPRIGSVITIAGCR